MEGYSGKRGASGIIAPKKGYNVGFKNASTNTDDHNARFCNRIGCSGRIKYSCPNTKAGTSEKAKFSNKPSSASSNVSETIGNSSSGTTSLIARARNSFFDAKTQVSSQSEFDTSESSQSSNRETSEVISSPSRNSTRHRLGSKNKTEEVVMIAKNGSSSSPSNIRPRKAFHRKSESSNQNNTHSAFSSFVHSNSKNSSPRKVNSSITSSSNDSSSSSSRCGMRNLKCESKSVVKNIMKKKNPEAESSLSRRGPQNEHLCPSSGGISISDSGRSHFASGDRKSGGSISTRPKNANNGRTRLSHQQNGRNSSSLRETSLRISQFSNSELRVHVGGRQFSASGSSSGSSSYSLSSSNSDNRSITMPFNTAELGFTHLTNHDQYNMDGIVEVLLAIERFEQDEELTHEQVLALEANLFLSGLNLYDQHRDMRLDIDNMSYEELLALEERMGTVSTALSKEALLKCIKKSIYDAGAQEVRATESGEDGDDIKCSICQEEYALGDETGKLVECQHGYHLACINQWLRLKNWCPICKASVAPQE